MSVIRNSAVKNSMRALLSLLVYSIACAASADDSLPNEVTAFMQLMTTQKAPTLADYMKFYGPNAEDETLALLKYCDAKEISRDNCAEISNSESQNPHKHISRFLSWVKKCYGTAGEQWAVLDKQNILTKGVDTGVVYKMKLNDSTFKLQYVFPHYRYDGLAVAILQVDGKDIDDVFNDKFQTCKNNPAH